MADMVIPPRVADSSAADQVAETASPNGAAAVVVDTSATAVGGGAAAASAVAAGAVGAGAVGAGAAAVWPNDAFLSPNGMGAVWTGDIPPPTLGQRIEMTGARAVDGLKQLVKPDPKKSEVHQSKMGKDVAEAKTAKSDGWPAESSTQNPRQQELAAKQKEGSITKEENAEYHALSGYPGNERMQKLSIKMELGTITDAELKEFQRGNSEIQKGQEEKNSLDNEVKARRPKDKWA